MARVEVYSKSHCPFCTRAKALLEEQGVPFEETDITHDPQGREEMIARAEGRRTVPQIFIDGQGIGGCDDLFALYRNGKLEELLARPAPG